VPKEEEELIKLWYRIYKTFYTVNCIIETQQGCLT
jgi:hypothetical protein